MPSFGETIRTLRLQKSAPLRVVAAAVEIDSTLLSRFELGDRFPTSDQLARFADYFQLPLDELTALVIADRILAAYGKDSVTMKAVAIVQERIAEYDAMGGKEPK
jgi:transcriptional regulator with XRE-family HTH domain